MCPDRLWFTSHLTTTRTIIIIIINGIQSSESLMGFWTTLYVGNINRISYFPEKKSCYFQKGLWYFRYRGNSFLISEIAYKGYKELLECPLTLRRSPLPIFILPLSVLEGPKVPVLHFLSIFIHSCRTIPVRLSFLSCHSSRSSYVFPSPVLTLPEQSLTLVKPTQI